MITVYSSNAEDYSGLGLGALDPMEAIVEEEAAGMYEATLKQQIDESHKEALIDRMRIIKLPAPVREGAIYEGEGSITREYYVVTGTSTGVRLRTGPGTSYKSLSTHRNGTMVLKLGQTGNWMQVRLVNGGATGYMSATYLTLDHTETEEITGDTPGASVKTEMARSQLFRIAGITRKSKDRIIEARAEHITYDLKGVIVVGDCSISNTSASYAIEQILAQQSREHPFTITCYASEQVSGEYGGRNIIDCLLNETDGIATQIGARVVRDNFTIYILPKDDVRDLGSEIRYAKNMLDAEFETDYSDIVTQIRPVGRTKDDEKLYIENNGGYVNSTKINNYPMIYTQEREYDVKVGEDGIGTKADAMAKLEELAYKDFENGIDEPEVRIDARYVREELTEEYKHIANEQALHMYDAVHVIDPGAGIKATLKMTRYKFDALMKMYTETEISGALSVADWTDRPTNLRFIQTAQEGSTLLYTVTLAWDHGSGDVQYKVTFGDETIYTEAGVKTATITDVAPGEYIFSVTPYKAGEEGIGNGKLVTIEDIGWKAAPEITAAMELMNSIYLRWSHAAENVTYIVKDNGTIAAAVDSTNAGEYELEIQDAAIGSHTIIVYATRDGEMGDTAMVTVEVKGDGWKAAPTDVIATAEGTTVTISWKHFEANDLMYYIYDNGSVKGVAQSGTGTDGIYSVTYTDVTAGEHTYAVTVFKDGVRGGTGVAPSIMVGDNSWKAAPTNLAVQDFGGDIIISWEHVSDDVAYEIAENGAALKQTSVGQKMTALSNQADGSHTYEVYAVKDGANGESGTVTVKIGDESWKVAPTNVRAVANGTSVTIYWTHKALAGLLYYIYDNGNTKGIAQSGISTGGEYYATYANINAGTHVFSVTVKKDGETGGTGTAEAITITDPNAGSAFPDAPRNFKAVRNGSYIDFSWDYYDMSTVSSGRIVIGMEGAESLIATILDLAATSYRVYINGSMYGTQEYYMQGLDLNSGFGEKSNTVELTIEAM